MKDLFLVDQERKSAVEAVIDRIKSLLIEKKLKPGDLIPSEHVLAESLRVSRGSVREAMKILSAFGVIEIRRGAGTYISNSDNQKIFDPLLFKILVNGSDHIELIEIRNMMEVGVIQLLMRHATDEEFMQLDELMKEFTRAVKADRAGEIGNTLDLKYHRMLGQMTHNSIVQNIYNFIIDLFAPTIDSRLGYETHRKLHEAIMERDEQKALAMVSAHTDTWKRAWHAKSRTP